MSKKLLKEVLQEAMSPHHGIITRGFDASRINKLVTRGYVATDPDIVPTPELFRRRRGGRSAAGRRRRREELQRRNKELVYEIKASMVEINGDDLNLETYNQKKTYSKIKKNPDLNVGKTSSKQVKSRQNVHMILQEVKCNEVYVAAQSKVKLIRKPNTTKIKATVVE